MPQWLIKSEVTLNPEYDVNCSELNSFFTEPAVNEIFLLFLYCMCQVSVIFLFNTLKINTLSDTCNFYLRLLGTRSIYIERYLVACRNTLSRFGKQSVIKRAEHPRMRMGETEKIAEKNDIVS